MIQEFENPEFGPDTEITGAVNGTEGNEDEQSIANPGGTPKVLLEAGYPTSKEDLLDYAREHEAEKDLIESLEKIPDVLFNNSSEVMDAIEEQEKQG